MVDRRSLEAKRKADEKIRRALLADLDHMWEQIKGWNQTAMANAFVTLLPSLVDKYGAAYAEVAAQWFEALTGETPIVAESLRSAQVQNSVRWALRPLLEAGAVEVARARLAGSIVRHAAQAGRDTLDASVRATDDVRYARRLSGHETCDFCTVLASRGPVYGTARDAGEGNRFHDGCDCEIVPVRGKWVAGRWVGEDPGYDFEKLYREEYEPYWRPGDTIDDVIERRTQARALEAKTKREASRGTKKPATPVTSGAGGGKKPPTRKNSASGAFNRDENLVPKVKSSMFGSITVEPGSDAGDSELRVGRILSHRGKNVVHLRVVHEKNRSNPDISVDGEIWEIKSPKGATKRTIENQFKRAKKQSGRFVLDLSRCGIPDEEAIRQAERRFFGTSGFSKMIIIDKEENVYFYQREHGRV